MIIYEWCKESVDIFGDIHDIAFADRLIDLSKIHFPEYLLSLVRRDVTDEGETERLWAYVVNGKLPDKFTDSAEHSVNINIPKRYRKELSEYFILI